MYLETCLNLYRQRHGLPETPYAYPECGRPVAKVGYPFLTHVYRRSAANGPDQVPCKVLLRRFVSENGTAEDVRLDTVTGMAAWLRQQAE